MTPIQETTAPRVGLPWRFVEQSTAADGSIIWTYQTRVIAKTLIAPLAAPPGFKLIKGPSRDHVGDGNKWSVSIQAFSTEEIADHEKRLARIHGEMAAQQGARSKAK